MSKTLGLAAKHAFSDLRPIYIDRPEPMGSEVEIEVMFCGVCHSDVHQAKNEWMNTVYPCMPGHEIVGRVSAIGAQVTKFRLGEIVGVGCMVDSCGDCQSCREGLENYCERGFLATYNGNMRTPSKENLTHGGYSERMVVKERFVLRMPVALDPAAAAPILCAGVTTYSPLRFWKVGPGATVGVVGFGGLGQMAVKIARAMGATVHVFTTSEEKRAAALRLGAADVVLSTEKGQMERRARSIDVMLSTIPQSHDPNPYLAALRRDGTYVVVGCLTPLKAPLDCSRMNPDRRNVGTTLIGGIAETQEALDFCAKHGIVSEIERISVDRVNEAFEDVDKGKVAFRYVLDLATLKGKTEDQSLLAKIGL